MCHFLVCIRDCVIANLRNFHHFTFPQTARTKIEEVLLVISCVECNSLTYVHVPNLMPLFQDLTLHGIKLIVIFIIWVCIKEIILPSVFLGMFFIWDILSCLFSLRISSIVFTSSLSTENSHYQI